MLDGRWSVSSRRKNTKVETERKREREERERLLEEYRRHQEEIEMREQERQEFEQAQQEMEREEREIQAAIERETQEEEEMLAAIVAVDEFKRMEQERLDAEAQAAAEKEQQRRSNEKRIAARIREKERLAAIEKVKWDLFLQDTHVIRRSMDEERHVVETASPEEIEVYWAKKGSRSPSLYCSGETGGTGIPNKPHEKWFLKRNQ